MLAFAKRRKEQRIARGCLTLASAEVKFEFDSETHENITDVHEYRLFETNSMVEEMMLLANEAVAAKIFSSFPACALLRNHPIPHPNMLVPLQNLAALFDIPLDTRSNKVKL
jgi:exoribonuclease R